jgi:hypothetical protein
MRGVNEIAQRFGVGVAAVAAVDVEVGSATPDPEMLAAQRAGRRQAAIQTVPIYAPGMTLSGGAGTLDVPDMLGPHDGYYWDLRTLSIQGFSAGTVSVYVNGVALQNFRPEFSSAGVYTFGKGQFILTPRDRLIFAAAGITGTVIVNGVAVQVEDWLWSEYLI